MSKQQRKESREQELPREWRVIMISPDGAFSTATGASVNQAITSLLYDPGDVL
jgi:hypothetical protein